VLGGGEAAVARPEMRSKIQMGVRRESRIEWKEWCFINTSLIERPLIRIIYVEWG
jgi:hypothetical protein